MKYKVDGVNVRTIEDEEIVAGSVNLHYAEFSFDESWDEYTSIIAVFKSDNAEREQLLDENRKCLIPWEVIAERGTLDVGIYGKTEDKARPTLWAVRKSIKGGAQPAEEAKEPTPDKWQQLLDGLKRIAGADPTVVEPIINEYMRNNAEQFKGEKGDPGDKGEFTEADKAEIAALSKPVASIATLTPAAWVDDSDTYTELRGLRVGYRKNDYYEQPTYIRPVSNPIFPNYEWQNFVIPFTLIEDASQFVPFFQGWDDAVSIQPYDIMACKLYATNDATKNLMSGDIEQQDWTSRDGLTETALLISDGVKYKHVFRQAKNYAQVHAWSRGEAIALAAGDYVFECRLRMTPWLKFCSVPVIEAHSENCVTVSPSNETAEAYASHNIRCEAFGSEQLIFSCDEIPSVDIKANAMVTKATGAEGLIFQPMRSGVDEKALLNVIGSGVVE